MVTVDKIDDLLKYFHQELAYLRSKGSEFAERYPKAAAYLELGPEGSTDPHVERLIESVAFLTGRLQRDIHKKFPEYSQQVLESLYPHLVTPIPSMSVAKLNADVTKLSDPKGYLVPKGTQLYINDLDGNTCQFHTCYDVTLWPITIESIRVIDMEDVGLSTVDNPTSKALSIQLKSHGIPLHKLQIRHLDFFLQGDRAVTHKIYDAVMMQNLGVYLREGDDKKVRLMTGARRVTLGLDPAHQLLPMPGNSHPAYGVLMDYFAFPKKFHYISLWNMDFSRSQHTCEIILPLAKELVSDTNLQNMCLGVTPIVNLFQKSTEPLKLDHTALKYKLTPDYRHEATTEIHSIQKVVVIEDGTSAVETIPPYFARHQWRKHKRSQRSWHTEREPSRFGGSDIHVSFVDENFDPKVLSEATVYAETLCTNRHMAETVPVWSPLESVTDLPVKRIEMAMHATPPRRIAASDTAYWHLIAHLNLNHLSLVSNNGDGLKNILRLYANPDDHGLIDGIVGVEQNLVTRRLTTDAWRGFVQGLEVVITLDQHAFEGYSPLIFGNVLRQFLALYTSINSFVELKLKWMQTGEIWKEWIPLSGRQQLL